MTDRAYERAETRRELLRRFILLALVLFAAGVGFGLLGLSLQIRQTQTDGTPTGRRIVSLQETINDCVNPEGACYQRSQKRTADVVSALNDGALFAVLCVQRNPAVVNQPVEVAVAQIKACVQDLAAQGE